MSVPKPKTIELTVRVRVPKDMSPAEAKYHISEQWYGEIEAERWRRGRPDVTLHPHWVKARKIIKEPQ